MARNNKDSQVSGQLCMDLSPVNMNSEHYVVQSNALLEGKQNLKLNSAKILRSIIMQIKPDDDDFKGYYITIPELSRMLNIGTENLYRNIDSITDDILNNSVAIKDYTQGNFSKYPWASLCEYKSGSGLMIKMNPLLKPLLLGLKERYTQYQLEDILAMRSVYAIRIYELLQRDQIMRYLPQDGAYIILTVQEIKEACDCEDKYERISQFKEKVIDVAIKEIVRCTIYNVNYECIKNGRTIEKLRFYVNRKYHKGQIWK